MLSVQVLPTDLGQKLSATNQAHLGQPWSILTVPKSYLNMLDHGSISDVNKISDDFCFVYHDNIWQTLNSGWRYRTKNDPYVLYSFHSTERQICREKVGELLGEKIVFIADNMNRHEYVPKMPNQSDLDLVFDTSFQDVQPYLFKVSSAYSQE